MRNEKASSRHYGKEGDLYIWRLVAARRELVWLGVSLPALLSLALDKSSVLANCAPMAYTEVHHQGISCLVSLL